MAAATPSATWTRQYDYAEPGFLEREVVTTATGVTTTEYVPDAAFNRASRTVTTASGSVTTTYAYDPGNRLSSVDSQPVDWNDFGETVTDHRGWDIDRAADGAEVALVDAAGIPAYGFTRGPGGEAIEVEASAAGDVRSFLWGPSEADFPVSILDEGGVDHLYVAAGIDPPPWTCPQRYKSTCPSQPGLPPSRGAMPPGGTRPSSRPALRGSCSRRAALLPRWPATSASDARSPVARWRTRAARRGLPRAS